MQVSTQPVSIDQPLRIPSVPTWMWMGAAALGAVGVYMAWRQYRSTLGG